MEVRAPVSVGYLMKVEGHGKVYYSDKPSNVVSHGLQGTGEV